MNLIPLYNKVFVQAKSGLHIMHEVESGEEFEALRFIAYNQSVRNTATCI